MWKSCIIGVGLIAAPHGAANAVLPKGHFGWMSELAGSCWQGMTKEGVKTDVQCYSEQYGKYLRGTIEMVMPQPSAMPYVGDSVFVWDPRSSRMTFHYWSSGGNSGVSTGYVEGERIIFDNPPAKDPTKAPGRSVWERLSPDSYRVIQQQRRGDDWQDLLSVTYTRVPTSGGAPSGKFSCTGEQYRRLDYMIGDWDVVERQTGKHLLYNKVESINGGCAIRETLEMAEGEKGLAITFFNPSTSNWQSFFHSKDHQVLLNGTTTPDGRNVLEATATLAGETRPTRVRQITSRDALGRPQQLGIGTSTDGKTRVLWDLTFCPRRSSVQVTPCNQL